MRNTEKIPKIVYESLPEGIQPIGRSRASWKDQVYKDVRIMGKENT